MMTREQAEKIADRIWGDDEQKTIEALLAAASKAMNDERARCKMLVLTTPEVDAESIRDYADEAGITNETATRLAIAAAIERGPTNAE